MAACISKPELLEKISEDGMRNLLICVALFLILLSCTASKPELKVKNEFSLNGIWVEATKKMSAREIKDITQTIIKDPTNYSKDFSWGRGVISPNGTWWFDISDKEKFFSPVSGPLFAILKIDVRDNNNMGTLLMTREYYEELKKQNLDHTVIASKANEVIFHFITDDQLDFVDPDQVLGIYTTKTHYLYRISRPGRP
jgi:hypothetical protein